MCGEFKVQMQATLAMYDSSSSDSEKESQESIQTIIRQHDKLTRCKQKKLEQCLMQAASFAIDHLGMYVTHDNNYTETIKDFLFVNCQLQVLVKNKIAVMIFMGGI